MRGFLSEASGSISISSQAFEHLLGYECGIDMVLERLHNTEIDLPLLCMPIMI